MGTTRKGMAKGKVEVFEFPLRGPEDVLEWTTATDIGGRGICWIASVKEGTTHSPGCGDEKCPHMKRKCGGKWSHTSHDVKWKGRTVKLETFCWGCRMKHKACAIRKRCPLNARKNARKNAKKLPMRLLSPEAEQLIQTKTERLRGKVIELRSGEGNEDDLVNVAIALDDDAMDARSSLCSICHDVARNERDGKPPITLPCGHVFHATCIQKWTPTSNTCPMCRGDAGMVPPVSATSAHGLLRNAAGVAEEAARAAADDTRRLGDERGSSPNDAIVVPE